jgi:hypothetical protein
MEHPGVPKGFMFDVSRAQWNLRCVVLQVADVVEEERKARGCNSNGRDGAKPSHPGPGSSKTGGPRLQGIT